MSRHQDKEAQLIYEAWSKKQLGEAFNGADDSTDNTAHGQAMPTKKEDVLPPDIADKSPDEKYPFVILFSNKFNTVIVETGKTDIDGDGLKDIMASYIYDDKYHKKGYLSGYFYDGKDTHRITHGSVSYSEYAGASKQTDVTEHWDKFAGKKIADAHREVIEKEAEHHSNQVARDAYSDYVDLHSVDFPYELDNID